MTRGRRVVAPALTALLALTLVAVASAAPPLVPLSTLLGPPDVVAPRLSPDGALLSWLAPVDGALNLFVAPADRPGEARAVTHERGRGLQAFGVSGDVMYRWTPDSRRLLYPRDRDGDEQWNWWCLDVATGASRALTPRPGSQVRLLATCDRRPDRVLFGINDRDPRLHDLWLLDLATDSLTRVAENPGFAAWMVDGSLTPRLAAAVGDGGAVWVLAADDTGGWRPLWSTAPGETPGRLVGFSTDGRTAWTLGARDRDKQVLVEVALPEGTVRVLAEDARVDVDGALCDPVSGRPQAYAVNWLRRDWKALDPAVEPDLAYLRTVADGDLEVLSRARDDRRWLVRYTLSDRPERYVLYERADHRVRDLFSSSHALEGRRFPKLHAAVIRSRDSLELVSYWSLPLASDPDRDGRPDRPLPMVMIVHGGPGDERAQYGFYPFVHWLTDRGYAVMNVNFRGSPGFGRAFQRAERLEWGGRMNLDLVDQARWAVDQGIARADRIGVLGGSYGGYAVLAALTLTPGVFACGVDVVGPADLETFIATRPPTWSLDHLAARIGDPRTEAGRAHLRARSPIHFADRVRVPVLVGQGAHDSRVPQAESDRMVAALERAGAPVTYVVFPDEGHGFLRAENDLAFWAVAEGFLARALGGRCQPIGDALEGSSIQVPAGAARVRGLEAALRRQPRR